MTVNWGILSTARINSRVIAAASLSDEAHILAVASRHEGRAKSYALDTGVERHYGNYDELLADPNIDAVYVSLPNSMHVDWSIRALERGKHVLCEKPMSRIPSDVEKAYSVTESTGLVLMEGFMYRHNPQTAKWIDLVKNGAIGPLRLVRSTFCFTIQSPRDVRLDQSLAGGSLMDVGSYCVHSARALLGEPERVFGEQLVFSGVDVQFSGIMRHADDVIVMFDSGLHSPRREELELVGETGSLLLGDPWLCRSPGITLRRDADDEHIGVEHADSYLLELENFGRAIRGEEKPLLDEGDAVAQARTIEALYRSADEGRPIALA
jgi:xylose dehydrogenase (NAD/NADP)